MEQEFTFKNESENWEASISGTYLRGSSDIFEEASAVFIYKGKEEIRAIYITTYTSKSRFERGTDVDELPADQTIETSFSNFGFWEAYEEGKEIILDFEWREGNRNTKKEDTITLTLVD